MERPGHGRVGRDPAEAARLAAEGVADLRDVAARYPDDPGVAGLLADLRAGSPEFVRVWDEGRVDRRRGSTKTVNHPELGPITLDCDVLVLPDTDQRLVVYSAAPGSPAAEALAVLRVVGLQELSPS